MIKTKQKINLHVTFLLIPRSRPGLTMSTGNPLFLDLHPADLEIVNRREWIHADRKRLHRDALLGFTVTALTSVRLMLYQLCFLRQENLLQPSTQCVHARHFEKLILSTTHTLYLLISIHRANESIRSSHSADLDWYANTDIYGYIYIR